MLSKIVRILRPPRSFRARLRLTFIAFGLGLALLLALVQAYQLKVGPEARAGRALKTDAVQLNETLRGVILERYNELGVLASTPAMRDAHAVSLNDPKKTSRRELLERQQQRSPEFSWIGIADPTGRVTLATRGLLEGKSVKRRPWFRGGKIGSYLGDVRERHVPAKLLPGTGVTPLHLLDLAMPLKDANGAVRGVLGAYLSFSWASKVKPVIQRADAEALVLARDGTVLLGPPELLGRSLTLPSLRRAQAEENGFGAEVWPDDIRYVAGFSQIGGLGDQPGLGWVVVRMKAEAPAFQWQTFIWSGGVGLVFTALGWFVAGRTTRRLQVVTQAAARVASGETLEDLPLLGREDELVSIAQHCANSQQARSATRRR